ncbi:MAG: metallophosphoesterase [Polyangiaceae bacterium]|nr:metallophosphoesterase [Polyangiaceae bacterium]
MKLFAISDLHVGFPDNRRALDSIKPRPDDWLIVGGDLGENLDHVKCVVDSLGPKFAKLIWVPGNHELWVDPRAPASEPRGEARYRMYVDYCQRSGVLCPEDPYVEWSGEGGPHLLVPMFLLYDYSFRPDHIPVENAVDWAAEDGIVAGDEIMLDPTPHASRSAWCHQRVALTEKRLSEAIDMPKVLINHFPLRQDIVLLPRVPRFLPWCGTRRTADWHTRYRASTVVHGHLHVRRTCHVDGVRFVDVSFGYPRERRADRPVDDYVRQILPIPETQ